MLYTFSYLSFWLSKNVDYFAKRLTNFASVSRGGKRSVFVCVCRAILSEVEGERAANKRHMMKNYCSIVPSHLLL